MKSREIQLPPEHIYPIDDWKIIQKKFTPQYLAQDETLFATGNGYLGFRGNHEEGTPVFQRGNTFINGFHEQWPIQYGESAYGFAKTGQTMLNVTDSKVIRLYVDDEPFYLPTADLKHYERVLDMKAGTLTRDILWETASGKRVSIQSTRIVSLEDRHVAAIYYEVKVLDAAAKIIVSSKMRCQQEAGQEQEEDDDPRKSRGFEDSVFVPQAHQVKDQRVLLGHQVHTSKMTLACGVDHMVQSESAYTCQNECYEDSAKIVYSANVQPGESFRLIKIMAYHSSRSAPVKELCGRAERTLDRAVKAGFEKLAADQQRLMDDFWARSDVEAMRKDKRTQQCLRFNLFHILQASARVEGAGIGARGLSGEAYEGHYFWDTEIYLMPFLIYTSPQVAKNLLRFRHSLLDKARQRAREVNQKGALFPWRTITGDEASAYFAAGTAQYHINADIVYALRKYVEVTGDEEFLFDYGAEMLIETARLWADLGFYSHDGKELFHIHGVTGPDEYTAIVNNNAFTNMMARENLRYAAESLELLREKNPERFKALAHDTKLEAREIDDWKKAAQRMYIPYDEEKGIHPQDDEFLKKEIWDFKNTPMEKYPLLLYFHPLVIYRYQVIKQADVAMAMFLLGHEFSWEQKKRNFDYYDPLTTGDSSLSACVHSILAVELGYLDRAVELIRYAALMDLADVGGNVKDGAHIASMGGTWMTVVYGLAGLRDYGGKISFNPRIPPEAEGIRFPLTVRGQMLEVDIKKDTVTYSLKSGDGLTIFHKEKELKILKDQPVKITGISTANVGQTS